ncbi:teichoic acids export ABC transporter ATP-binding subunit TagH [Neobacillus jeddahensis]|uniref:teichoic acids export ABC transporter ATP-binding subunit TagH n=1 Tax=Neobacillus jeddahensis TaxID=1461580 RepID=UPI00058FBC9E|nr:teichoic acids export ABC transporter ATP-binding subunit TagH [Neobacillus jeddahensis]
MSSSVTFKGVTKKYKMYKKTSDKLLDLIIPNGYGKDFYALQNISFEADKGDVIGIIGVNGAGKSTMSNIISGVIPPTLGTLQINGEVALISIGAGLNNQLTGRENIELKCLMLGFSKQKIQELMPDIIEFADIGDFIDQPVKKYSSGMKSRLGFAISVNIDPDILVIDEALSVGDKTFYQKCLDKMNNFKEKGKTIFFISHSIGQVKDFCEKALWLEAGGVKAYGPVEEVIPQYEKFIKEYNKMSKEEKKQFNQRVNEKRSRKQVKEEPNNSSTQQVSEEPKNRDAQQVSKEPKNQNAQQVSEEINHSDLTRTSSRKKPKAKKGIVVKSLLVVFLLLASTVVYLKWPHVMNYFQADKKVHGTNAEDGKTAKDTKKKDKPVVAEVEQKDVRYVNLISGFVRDMPDLASSTKITMMYFGDPITVEQTVKDPVQDFNWLQFTLANGQKGWISERLVSEVVTQPNQDDIVTGVGQLVDDAQLAGTLSLFGKTKEEVDTENNSESTLVSYNNDGKVDKINLTLEGVTTDELVGQLGEPILQEDEKAYMYHGKGYDFIFYAGNGTSFNLVTVRAHS